MNFAPAPFNVNLFYKRLIEIIHYVYPDAIVVQRNQNKALPVDIDNNGSFWVVNIERIAKIGTDYDLSFDDNGVWTMRGDRLVQVLLDVYGPNALERVTAFRDWFETSNLFDFAKEREIVMQRPDDEPVDTTRVHGNNQYIPSAILIARFHASIDYIDDRGLIETGTIHGEVNGRTIETPYSVTNP